MSYIRFGNFGQASPTELEINRLTSLINSLQVEWSMTDSRYYQQMYSRRSGSFRTNNSQIEAERTKALDAITNRINEARAQIERLKAMAAASPPPSAPMPPSVLTTPVVPPVSSQPINIAPSRQRLPKIITFQN